jgi:hypothetical protein
MVNQTRKESAMDENTLALLNRIYAAVEYMTELENQDRSMVIEMSQAMLNDVIETGELQPMFNYVKRYCDVIDGPDDIERIASDI